MPIITEEIIDKAIDAAELGHVNGLTYDQSSWCGTACCVLGFARHIAGLPERDAGPSDDEFDVSPRITAIRKLMGSPTPAILGIMRKVSSDGNIDLTDTNLRGANLRGANLTGANLTDANLRGANLMGANLRDTNLMGANLRGANLMGANLRDTNLMGANLMDTDLRGANLTGANLMGANLTDTNLMGAVRWDTDSYVAVTPEWLIEKGAML